MTTRVQRLIQSWKKCIDKGRDFVKSFIKDVPMIYVNFIIIVVDSEENNRHYVCNDLHTTT